MNNKSNPALIHGTELGTLISIVAAIIIGVLVWKGTLHFHWAYITAPKLFWAIFFSIWLWEVYCNILFWLLLMFASLTSKEKAKDSR